VATVSSSAGTLAGRGIVVTRPAHQAGPLAARIAAAGGRVILFPAIAILDPAEFAPFNALIDRLHEFDLAIFISPNAVNKAMKAITARRALPVGLVIAAVGHATANALHARGVSNVIAPADGVDSEALLGLPALETMAGRRVVIFRGEGGRELLGDALTARGARVEYAECYRRVNPRLDPAPLFDAWAREELHAVVVTSSEGLDNLWEMLGKKGQTHLVGTPLFVPHPRIAASARLRGLSKVVTTGAGDDGIVAGLCTYFSSNLP
jgi:uroporphyrinogen-III synthase